MLIADVISLTQTHHVMHQRGGCKERRHNALLHVISRTLKTEHLHGSSLTTLVLLSSFVIPIGSSESGKSGATNTHQSLRNTGKLSRTEPKAWRTSDLADGDFRELHFEGVWVEVVGGAVKVTANVRVARFCASFLVPFNDLKTQNKTTNQQF